jgi:hypothetical protein
METATLKPTGLYIENNHQAGNTTHYLAGEIKVGNMSINLPESSGTIAVKSDLEGFVESYRFESVTDGLDSRVGVVEEEVAKKLDANNWTSTNG